MRQSQFFMPTLKETPSDAEAISHQMMLRGGYIRQVTAGVYAYLPLANIVLTKISNIVRDEMAKINVPEMMMPIFLPADLWIESGRYENYGPNLFKLKDRHDRDSILGPTHEETFTDIVAKEIFSYKKLPFMLYQIQTKFRDENRPRFGLLRGREFIMQDVYSFAATEDQLDQQFNTMKKTYEQIFDRVGLKIMEIIADAGAMGGTASVEFQAPAAIGEDTIAYTKSRNYAANLEMAQSIDDFKPEVEAPKELEKVATPGQKTIADLAKFMGVPETKIVKSVLYLADDKPVLVLIRGDKMVNEVKLTNLLHADNLAVATDGQVLKLTNSQPGGVGPINLDQEIGIVADESIKNLSNFIVGANETDYQFKNVNFGRDFTISEFVDVRNANEGELDVKNHEPLIFDQGIEIGHIFKLGTRYSKAMNAVFLDENGKEQPVIMGSYGIGISRLLSALIEQNHTDRGIVWPKSVAPFAVQIIQMKMNDEAQTKVAEDLYQELSSDYDVMYDDRNERPGVKFADADLMGAPIRIIVGKNAPDGIVEIKHPLDEKSTEIKVSDVISTVKNEIG